VIFSAETYTELKRAVEAQHGCKATVFQSVPIKETFGRNTVWEGVVHVFSLTGHPTAKRAYAWSSPRCGRVRRAEVAHRQAVERIIGVVELERYRHAAVGALPFGVQKIVGFARALALEPSIMMLDEPSAGLNREEREDLARFILRIKHELGMTMIWIEHDMQLIADLADRIHVLDYGRTIAEGIPEAVLSDQNVLAAYLGTPAQGNVPKA
jgi:ABC-type branched-subunit amino acid transport system ATPase component